jgi:DNA mismatch endonuclease, patch repair protein
LAEAAVRRGVSQAGRSRIMRAIKSRNTSPELAVRRLLHAKGHRFRLHRRDLPGKPDIVLPKHKAVIFVHGCFWHQHPDPGCRNAQVPRSNTAYWSPKLARTIERDRSAILDLQALGWRVLVVWECETKQAHGLLGRLEKFLG